MSTSNRIQMLAPNPAATLAALAPDHAAAEDRNVRRFDAGDAAQENPAAHLRPFEVFGPFLDAHPPGHLAHGRQQRQPAVARFASVS